MIHAYNELYLNNVMKNLASFFDISINALNFKPNEIADKFAKSNIAKGIEYGNPNYLCGKSAKELLIELLKDSIEFDIVPTNRTKEYWAGFVLAYIQWYLDRPFSVILSKISFDALISYYNPYHEAPEAKIAEKIKKLYFNENSLKHMRLLRKLTQKQLSILSGVKLRSIECYEQGDIDICKAEAGTLYALAKTLDCTIEDLIR